MKYFFYSILFLGLLGTVAGITNPSLVQQAAALIGLELPNHSEGSADKTSNEDQLSKFLEQYPSVHNHKDDVLPASSLPMVSMHHPPPSSHSSSIPTPPPIFVPEPILAHAVEPIAQAYTPSLSWDASSWDSAASTPILTPVISEPSPDWSGPAQPYHEFVPAPHHSIYIASVPPHDATHVTHSHVTHNHVIPTPVTDPFSSGFVQPHHTAPVQTMPTTPSPVSQPVSQSLPLQTPSPIPPPIRQSETVPVPGTEMAARVGTQVILMGDILPRLRRLALQIVAENIKQMPEEERAHVTQDEIAQFVNMFAERQYPEMLQEQILFTLVYSDYYVSQDAASRTFFSDKMGEEFDRNEVPAMMKEFNVENITELRRYLEEQLGSSLEKERRLWVREQIVREWMRMSMQRATGDCTHEEMLDFYEKNQAMFTSPNRARWQEMVVLFSRHDTEKEAWDKSVWMGNQVIQGAPFEEIARLNSDGFTASNGGVWDWTTKGSLTSEELEQAIFSQPIGQLSPSIIRTDRGLHIVRVLEREESKVTPFVEAQVTIRERIRNQRGQRHQDEYIAELRRRIPTVVVKDRIDFDVNTPRTASR